VHGITVNSCTFGKLGVFKLRMAMNVGLAVAAPVISQKLGKIALPKSLFGWFELSDLVIKYYDGYLGVGATPTFTPPPLPPAPENSYNASRICITNKAGFVMRFHLKDKYTGVECDDTEHYPIGKSNCIDIKEVFPLVREGETIKTIIEATAGKTNPASHLSVYTADPTKITWFTCKGTTLNYHCNDDDLDASFASLFDQ